MKWFRDFLCRCQLSELVSDYCQMSNFSAISWREQIKFWRDDDDVCVVLDCNQMLIIAKWATFQLYHGGNKLNFDEMMMMMSALYWTAIRCCSNHMKCLFLFIATKIRRGTMCQGRFGQDVVQWWRLNRLDSISLIYIFLCFKIKVNHVNRILVASWCYLLCWFDKKAFHKNCS